MKHWNRWLSAALAASLAAACGDPASEPDAPGAGDEATPPIESDLVPPSAGGKSDTGYLSDLATELEGVFQSEITVDLSEKTEDERKAYQERLLADPAFAATVVAPQVKFAKNEINAAKLHLNLSASDVEVVDAGLDEDGKLRVVYKATVETIVTQVELEEDGTTIEEVLAGDYSALLPDDPTRMASDVGKACLEEGHEEAHDYNYFYYYDPDREGCAEAMEAAGIRRVAGRLELHSLAPSKTVYPEYDQLVADGRVDVVAFFGAADHDWEPGRWDWGTYSRDNFVRDLRARGFEKRESHEGEGDLYQREMEGLVENVVVVGPETLKLLKDDADGLFKKLVRESEIVFYNGHSFYGSLDVLDDPEIYPGRYQIFFMNSCWSYEYYTKQIFANNRTEDDPEGWRLADVVNDTESGWFHNMAPESRILLTNLLRGAETGGVEGDRYYTWDRIIGQMNKHARDAQASRGTETHEIYGVSGVRTNAYEPGGDR